MGIIKYIFKHNIFNYMIDVIIIIISIASMTQLFIDINLINFFIGMIYLLLSLIYSCDIFNISLNIFSPFTYQKIQFILSHIMMYLCLTVFIIMIFRFQIKKSFQLLENDKEKEKLSLSFFDNSNGNKNKFYFSICFFFVFCYILKYFEPPHSNLKEYTNI